MLDDTSLYAVKLLGCQKISDYLFNFIHIQVKYSRKLISADHSANIGEFKHNFIVELVPLCKVVYRTILI